MLHSIHVVATCCPKLQPNLHLSHALSVLSCVNVPELSKSSCSCKPNMNFPMKPSSMLFLWWCSLWHHKAGNKCCPSPSTWLVASQPPWPRTQGRCHFTHCHLCASAPFLWSGLPFRAGELLSFCHSHTLSTRSTCQRNDALVGRDCQATYQLIAFSTHIA